MQKHRSIKGRIRYISIGPGRSGLGVAGAERGRETFHFTHHTDGKVSFRAHCEIDEPDPTVLRDVTYSIDENGRPMDCFVRLTVGDVFMGSGLFIFTDDAIECESYGPTIGRVSQRVAVTEPYDGFGTHPIAGDAYFCRCLDISKGPTKRKVTNFLPSMDHRGASPPMIVASSIFLEYVGDEEVTVPAGTFRARKFRFSDEEAGMATADGAHPTYDMWVTADDDFIFLKGSIGGYMDRGYELIELER